MSVQNNKYIYLQIQKSLLLITSNEYTVITMPFGHLQWQYILNKFLFSRTERRQVNQDSWQDQYFLFTAV